MTPGLVSYQSRFPLARSAWRRVGSVEGMLMSNVGEGAPREGFYVLRSLSEKLISSG